MCRKELWCQIDDRCIPIWNFSTSWHPWIFGCHRKVTRSRFSSEIELTIDNPLVRAFSVVDVKNTYTSRAICYNNSYQIAFAKRAASHGYFRRRDVISAHLPSVAHFKSNDPAGDPTLPPVLAIYEKLAALFAACDHTRLRTTRGRGPSCAA